MSNLRKIEQLPLSINLHEIIANDIDQFQQICRSEPDLVPHFVNYADSQLSYMVGFWWLALDEGQKTQALEKHPIFAEKYSFQTCADLGFQCSKIPVSFRNEVIQKLNMKVVATITRATSDETELTMLFNTALATGISARNMQLVIQEWKANKSLGETLINQLPEVLEGDRKDKDRLSQLLFQLKTDVESRKAKLIESQEELDKQKIVFNQEKVSELRKAQEQANELVKKAKKDVIETEKIAKKIIEEANQKALKLPEEKAKKILQEARDKSDEILAKAVKLRNDSLIIKTQREEELKKVNDYYDNPIIVSKQLVSRVIKDCSPALLSLLNNHDVTENDQQFIKNVMNTLNEYLAG